LFGGTFEARKLQATVLDGQVAADLTILHLADKPEARLEGTMRSVSLRLRAALRTKAQEHIEITGRLDGTVKASWHGNLQALQVRSDAVITAQAPAGVWVCLFDGACLAYGGDSEVVSLELPTSILPTPY
jgi:hypothetical protein